MSITYPDDRWAWAEIDLGAIRRNTRAFKSLLPSRTQMMCAVKADGYGHGAVACAKAMHQAGASQFAVATVAEGIELRAAGITWPILMLNQAPLEAIDKLIEFDIMPSVFTTDFALAYGERAAALDKVGKYHLAIDTGMTRIGVQPADAVEFCRSIDFHRGLKRMGTFTHFATADALRDWDFELQANRFAETIRAINDAHLGTGLVHCDNTPGTVLHTDYHADMVRLGIGLYGLQPADSTAHLIQLEPAMSVRGRVTRVIFPQVGSGVGYGMTWRVPKSNVQVATVPIGYADGYSRELSGKVDVLVKGNRHHQVGNICMDQFMFAVDVNSIRSYRPSMAVSEGDIVTVMGADGDDRISAEDLAEVRGTINYEIVCGFGMRLPKVYV